MEKRLDQYRKILKKDQMLFEVSEQLYEKEDPNAKSMITLFVMAPIMCRYVLWVLWEALSSGKRRLYFLARDGYSMYQMATVFCEKLQIPIDCRYLYCSRYAWRSAAFCVLKEESLSYICLGGIEVNFERVMHRAGLGAEEALEVAGLLGFAEKRNVPLSYAELKALKPLLANCQLFMDNFFSHAEEKYPSVCGYLKQEGLLEKIPYGIVDSGWTGSMQKTLQCLLKSMGSDVCVEGYYFGLYEYPQDVETRTYHAWYFEPDEELRRKVYFSNSLFECIFSSPEGMTLGYVQQGEIYIPLLEHKYNPNKEKLEKSTALLKKYAVVAAEAYAEGLLVPALWFRETAAALLYFFMGRPTLPEAEAFGGYVFCDDVIGEEAQSVAALLTYKEVKENRVFYKGANMLLKKGKPIRESAWLEGSTVLLSETGKGDLRQCALYKYVLYLRKLVK